MIEISLASKFLYPCANIFRKNEMVLGVHPENFFMNVRMIPLHGYHVQNQWWQLLQSILWMILPKYSILDFSERLRRLPFYSLRNCYIRVPRSFSGQPACLFKCKESRSVHVEMTYVFADCFQHQGSKLAGVRMIHISGDRVQHTG